MKLITVRTSLVALALVAPLSTAMAGSNAQAGQQGQGSQKLAAYATVSDAQIAGVLRVATDNELDAATLATKKAQDPAVRDFAAQMSKDHTDLAKEAKQLFDQQGIQAEDSTDSLELRARGLQDRAMLQLTPEGKGFDQEYIKEQVDCHQKLLDLINQTILPAVQNADVRAFVEKVQTIATGHLETAKRIQQDLGGM